MVILQGNITRVRTPVLNLGEPCASRFRAFICIESAPGCPVGGRRGMCHVKHSDVRLLTAH